MPVINWNIPHRDAKGLMPAFIGWLRRDRWFTDTASAERSALIYSPYGWGVSGTSILGVINGILPKIGLVIVVYAKDGQPVSPWIGVHKRWW